jgi:ribonuclease-3
VRLSRDLRDFSARIGHDFATPSLLVEAVTHASVESGNRSNNERLEFLGDRVLGLVMAQALLHADQDAAEGQLAPRFNAMVRKETCAEVARQIELGQVLRLGRSEMRTGGRRKMTLLGDAMEAVIAAVYLDGGFDAARDMVLRLWGDRIARVEVDARDAKTTLQEWAQARGLEPPSYVEEARRGPDHDPVFDIRVKLASGESAVASAGSKRLAEQAAARELLSQLGGDGD